MTKPLKPAVKIIREAKRLLKRGWTKQYQARDKSGHYISCHDRRATCWCMIGALSRASKGDFWINIVGGENIYKVFGTVALHRVNDNAESVEELIDYLSHLEDVCA